MAFKKSEDHEDLMLVSMDMIILENKPNFVNLDRWLIYFTRVPIHNYNFLPDSSPYDYPTLRNKAN